MWLKRKDGHLPPFNAEVKNKWRRTSRSPMCLRGVCMNKLTFAPSLPILSCPLGTGFFHGVKRPAPNAQV